MELGASGWGLRGLRLGSPEPPRGSGLVPARRFLRRGAGGSWPGCGFGQASRVFWRLGGVIAIAAPGPLGHLTSTCDVGVKYS